jgi:hypothetical protein
VITFDQRRLFLSPMGENYTAHPITGQYNAVPVCGSFNSQERSLIQSTPTYALETQGKDRENGILCSYRTLQNPLTYSFPFSEKMIAALTIDFNYRDNYNH